MGAFDAAPTIRIIFTLLASPIGKWSVIQLNLAVRFRRSEASLDKSARPGGRFVFNDGCDSMATRPCNMAAAQDNQVISGTKDAGHAAVHCW